jgi:hemolysin III
VPQSHQGNPVMTDRSKPRTPAIDSSCSPLEEWFNTVTHGIAALLSIAGTVALLMIAAEARDPWKIVSFAVFGASLVLLYFASSTYHSCRHPELKRRFKMLDHCAIYVLIAGTYTPFLLVNMRGTVGWMLFAAIWLLAAGGIGLKLIYGHRLKLLRVAIYLGMGWLIVVAATDLAASVNAVALRLIIAGGVVYTAGVVFYLADRIPFNHAIWHLFVLGGSVCHFLAVFYGVSQYTS